MEKKSIRVILVTVLLTISIATIVLVWYFNTNASYKLPSNRTEIMKENSPYVNYAEEVKFDVEKFPELIDQGLFWTSWDDEKFEFARVAADSKEGAALVDPSKPTVIFVHGMTNVGHLYSDSFEMHTIGEYVASEFGIDKPTVPFVKLWIEAGWNVGIFDYAKFASEFIFYHLIEGKIWGTDSKSGTRFRYYNGEASVTDVSEYALAEHFVAEYSRAMKLLPDSFGTKEIR
ncbi:MAG: hypothetical protein LBE09_00935, partial [Christensenellaceae bacterium]|nr:hypothetical protein [Christensenellaceae bacterium]